MRMATSLEGVVPMILAESGSFSSTPGRVRTCNLRFRRRDLSPCQMTEKRLAFKHFMRSTLTLQGLASVCGRVQENADIPHGVGVCAEDSAQGSMSKALLYYLVCCGSCAGIYWTENVLDGKHISASIPGTVETRLRHLRGELLQYLRHVSSAARSHVFSIYTP